MWKVKHSRGAVLSVIMYTWIIMFIKHSQVISAVNAAALRLIGNAQNVVLPHHNSTHCISTLAKQRGKCRRNAKSAARQNQNAAAAKCGSSLF